MKKNKEPIFSILIPTYNRKELLKEALNSIFNQTFKGPMEIIVVDDGSTDGTWEYLEKLKKEQKNLIIEKHKKNKGVAEARNTALSLLRGEYALFLDSDDYLLENALSRMYQEIERDKYHWYLISVYIEKNNKRKLKLFPEPPIDSVIRLKYFIDGVYSDGLNLIRKDLFKDFYFYPKLRVREDWVFKGTLFALNIPKIINEPLGVIRDHPNRLRKKVEFYEENLLFSVDLLFQSLPSEFQELYFFAKAKAYIELASKYLQAKNPQKGFENLKKALNFAPYLKKDFKFLKKFIKSFLLKIFQRKNV